MGIDPVTLSLAAVALTAGSGVMSYTQQRKADKKAKTAANAEADIMQQDAVEQARQERLAAKDHRAQQKVLYLASGVDLSGSPLLEMQRTTRQGQYNADNVLSGSARRADLTRYQGGISRASLIGSSLSTGASALSGYSNAMLLKKQLSPVGIG